MTRILGAILAGGRSTRFGSDKALASLDGRALIDRVADAIAPQVDTLIVVGRAHPGLIGIPDRPAPDLGPLGGIAAALHYAAAQNFAQVLTVPCDAPFLPAGLRLHLSDAGPAVHLAALPVVGWWPASAGATLDALLAGGGSRSVRAFADRIGALGMTGPTEIPNINTPDDLALLAKRDIADR
ncbi:molybdenum cofactor guanylyltransferase [uncultured Sphingomonas sp.]|uniref:molybdenum cofactor guanylyltransferase n=1 Tax=uncultured Sphingomonas sp. TaxID=158754 RepID=UPI0025F7A1AB|nr:molybdenum cofactor guanylyltransferase [uncultured Sphingomonas sp.]